MGHTAKCLSPAPYLALEKRRVDTRFEKFGQHRQEAVDIELISCLRRDPGDPRTVKEKPGHAFPIRAAPFRETDHPIELSQYFIEFFAHERIHFSDIPSLAASAVDYNSDASCGRWN